MSCHLVEPSRLAEEKLGLPLTRGDDEDGGTRDGECLMHGQDRAYRALARLTAAAQYLARVLTSKHFYLPWVGILVHTPGELDGVVGEVGRRSRRDRIPNTADLFN